MEPLTLTADVGIAFFLAVGLVYAVQGVKWIAEILPTTKTNALPNWVWVGAALIIGMGICYWFKVDQIGKLFESADVNLPPPWSYFATGLAIAISSNVIYAATKPLRKKLKTKEGKILCLPPGQALPIPDTPVAPETKVEMDPLAPSVQNVPSVQTPVPHWPTARLLLDVTPEGKSYFIALDRELYQVEPGGP